MTLRADRLFVLFRLAGSRLAIASERVLEVREGRPGRASHGRLRYRGVELARIDLRARFGLPPVSEPGQVIIAQAGEALVALHVDLIEAVVPLTEAILDVPEPLRPFLGDDVAGIGRFSARPEGDEDRPPDAEVEDAEPVWEVVLVLGERALAGAARAFATGTPPSPTPEAP